MKFCPECQSLMSKTTTPSGNILFHCRCQLVIDGGDDDSLMAEQYLETAESNHKHDVFIENSPYDQAGNIIEIDCPDCGLNFMTMVRIGVRETVMYTCSCSCIITREEYIRKVGKK
jgi:DNA-directed RNA polymerase subunit M/transcription elongation factor TFIIS